MVFAQSAPEQTPASESAEKKLEQLTAAVAEAQAQMDAYQKQLVELRQQIATLQQQIAAGKPPSSSTVQPSTKSNATDTSDKSPATIDEIRERQAIQESEIATHDVSKVETESKYPLKVTGMLLLNGFVNTKQVDISASPAYAISGPGSTGLSLRQTVLGLDARGPHLFGATSRADLRVDFFANDTQSNYAASGVLRLRTVHASLDWENSSIFFALDRSLLEPNSPTSLVAVAQPELAWAGNLWNWSPQIGLSHQFAFSSSSRAKVQAALIDTSDPPPPASTYQPSVTQTERSRWPGSEARLSFLRGENHNGPEIGVGGYFSPHRTNDGGTFNAWAGSVDLRLPVTRHFEITSDAHRGQALAGLGGGGYVNYYDQYVGTVETTHALDDVGGWAQLKARAGQRIEMNAGFGTDNPFAKEIQAATLLQSPTPYPGLVRNRSFYSNVIYSPSAYLLFSLEYKRLWTNDGTGPTAFSDSIGIGAGYKF